MKACCKNITGVWMSPLLKSLVSQLTDVRGVYRGCWFLAVKSSIFDRQ